MQQEISLRRASKSRNGPDAFMQRIPITDIDDPRIAVYRSLKATNQTRWLGQFVVEGERLVERLVTSHYPVVSVLLTDRHEPQLSVAVPASVPIYVLPHDLITDLVGFRFHRGVLACGARRSWPSLNAIIEQATGAFTLVVCPKLSNPDNLGTIARIGDVFGINAILTGTESPDPLSRRVLRVSMGAVLRLPVIVSQCPGAVAELLMRERGFQFWGAVADSSAQPFHQLNRPERLALVVGEEDRGIDPEWLQRCDRLVTIPMREGASSLNVAVAAGILLHWLARDYGV
jgi:tRNA G18 (ribose-2'-O)-methylase SpoU